MPLRTPASICSRLTHSSSVCATQPILGAMDSLPHFEHTFLETLRIMIRHRGARPETALSSAVLSGVRQPLQLVWGDDDPMGSSEIASRVAEALPDADLHVVEGGHAPWLTQAVQIGSLATTFLKERGTIHHAA